MNFTHYDLGNLNKGRVVEVHLTGNAANVYLVDNGNLGKYKRGIEFQAVGGLMKSSPIRLQTAITSHWHIVIDLPNGYGTVKTSYRVLNNHSTASHDKLMNFRASTGQMRSVSAPSASPVSNAPASARPAPSAAAGKGVICTKCGKETPAGKFCPECGTALDKKCPQCSTVSANASKFCLECGCSLG